MRSLGLFALILCITTTSCLAGSETAAAEAYAHRYMQALLSEGIAETVEFTHPSEIDRFRDMFLPMVIDKSAPDREARRELFFGKGATDKYIRGLSPSEFMRAVLRFGDSYLREEGVSFGSYEVIGSVPEDDLMHVLTRITVVSEVTTTQVTVLTLKKTSDGRGALMGREISQILGASGS